jgi:dTDP-4-dehydrorhamnose reductase
MSAAAPRILLTGARGRLGTELCALLPEIVPTDLPGCDITQPGRLLRALEEHAPDVIVHAAAYTDVAGAERDRATCWNANVDGTRNVARCAALVGAFLVHISTDYVFEGTTGDYHEDDPVGPVRNYYALSKLVAEELARCAPEHLVIRTSFRPREWPYATAFTDVYTSQDYVDVIAPEIALAIRRCREIPVPVIHIATERKSVYDLARRRSPDVRPGSKAQVGVPLPDDISLNTERWMALRAEWGLGPMLTSRPGVAE